MIPEQMITAHQLRENQMPLLKIVWQAWKDTLPSDAQATWRKGCVYIRESSVKSLAGSAAEMQLRNTLALMASKKVYVPWEAVFFDNASGTDTKLRPAFRRLFEEAIAGGFEVVGVFVSDRLFRNVAQATKVKREFRRHGIEIEYLGRFEGDPRNPARWHMEVMQDVAAEMQARTTGFHVGSHLEALTASGHPVGLLPEAYEVLERAPSYMGHRGSVTKWGIVEPLASVIIQGKDRYIAGDSHAMLGRWALTTELEGKTPKGRWMNAMWWRTTLRNTKYAGFQEPSHYEGFKSGDEAPKAAPKTKAPPPQRVLVPCKLPALWTLEEHQEIVKLGLQRMRSTKVRRSYRSYLLVGVAFDATCGSAMTIQAKRPNGGFYMHCRVRDPGDKHTGFVRAEVAEAELDDLISGLSLNDEVLVAQVEKELADLANHEGLEVDAFQANPAIAGIRRAIIELRVVGVDPAELQARASQLEEADNARRDALAAPVAEFRAASDRLRNWAAVWREGDTTTKNQLLRDAGLHVVIGRDPGEETGPAHIQSIAAENPVFELALAISLANPGLTLGGQTLSFPSNVRVVVHVSDEFIGIAGKTSRLESGGAGIETWVRRPSTKPRAPRLYRHGPRKPHARKQTEFWGPPLGPEYLSLAQVAVQAGRSLKVIRDWVRKSDIEKLRRGRGQGKLFLLESDVRQYRPQDYAGTLRDAA
jgi:Resolvase, N terminal domain